MLLIVACGCSGRETGAEQPMPSRDINVVMKAHTDELMAVEGVVGVAIGQTDAGVPCILVLVVKKTDSLTRHIAQNLEGHPVVIRETGEIKALDGNND